MAENTKNESTEWLYNELKGKGYDVGETYDEFDGLMRSNGESRRWAFETATHEGLNVGNDIDEFTSLVAPSTGHPQAQGAQQAGGLKPEAPSGQKAFSPDGSHNETEAGAGANSPGGSHSETKGGSASSGEQGRKARDKKKEQELQQLRGQLGVLGAKIKHGKQQIASNLSATREKAERAMKRNTPEGRKQQQNAEYQALISGQGSSAFKLNPVAPGGSSAGNGGTGGRNGDEGVKFTNPQSPTAYGMTLENGKWTPQWLMPDGSLTTSRLEASNAEWIASNSRLQHEFERRMKDNGLDVSKKEDVSTQATIDAVHSGFNIDPEQRKQIQDAMRNEGLDPKDMQHVAWVIKGDNRSILQYRLQGAEQRLKSLYAERQRFKDEMAAQNADNPDAPWTERLEKALLRLGHEIGNPVPLAYQNMPASTTGAGINSQATPFDKDIEEAYAEVGIIMNALREYDNSVEASQGSWYGNIWRGICDAGKNPNTYTMGVFDASLNNTVRNSNSNRLLSSFALAEQLKASSPEAGAIYEGAKFGGEMLFDPSNWLILGVGAAAKSGAESLVRKGVAKGMEKEVAEQYLKHNLLKRLAVKGAGEGGFFFAFDALRDAKQQLIDGGWVDEGYTDAKGVYHPGQFHEGFSISHMLRRGGQGFLVGSAMGMFGAGWGNASRWLNKVAGTATSRTLEGAVDRAVVRGIDKAVGFVGEGTIFGIPEMYRYYTMDNAEFDYHFAKKFGYGNEKDPAEKAQKREEARNSLVYDAWTGSMANLFALKASNQLLGAAKESGVGIVNGLMGGKVELPRIVKTVGETLADLRKKDERDHRTFPERLHGALDKNLFDVKFTADEIAEYEQYYGDIAKLLRTDRSKEERKRSHSETKRGNIDYERGGDLASGRSLRAADPRDGEVTDAGEQKFAKSDLDGYSLAEQAIMDKRLSQAARAKLYFMITQHMLPMATVSGYNTITNSENGEVIVQSVSMDGEVITSRRFKNMEAAEPEITKIRRQMELNTIEVGEKYREAYAEEEALKRAIGRAIEMEEADVEGGSRLRMSEEATQRQRLEEMTGRYFQYKNGGAVDEATERFAERVDEYLAEERKRAEMERPEGIREQIKDDFGVDVDEALKKPFNERTEHENEAIEEYGRRLFPKESAEFWETPKPDQAQEERRLLAEQAQQSYDEAQQVYEEFSEGNEQAQADIDDIAIRVQDAMQTFEDAFGVDAEQYMGQLQSDPWSLVSDPTLMPDQKDAVLYYINSKAALDGIQDASTAAAERKRNEVQQEVGMRTHKDTGAIQPATMKVDGREVYVVKGNVRMYEDGSDIDRANSDQQVYIYDPSTGKYEAISPDFMERVGEPISPDEEVRAAHTIIDAEQQAFEENLEAASAQREISPDGSHNETEGGLKPGTPSGQKEEDAEAPQMEEATEALKEAEAAEAPQEEEQYADVEAYDRGYEQGYEQALEMTDEQLNGEIETMRAAETLDDAGRGRLEALEHEQQERELEISPEGSHSEPNEEPEGITTTEGAALEEGTPLSLIPINEETGEPDFEKADKETAWGGLVEAAGGDESVAIAVAKAQIEQAQTEIAALQKNPPKLQKRTLKGSPMAMLKAQKEANDKYQEELAAHNQKIADGLERIKAWQNIMGVHTERQDAARREAQEEQRQRDAVAREQAQAEFEEQQRIKAEKAEEQAAIGTHAVHPKLKEKWDNAPKVEGHADVITLPDGSQLRGRYVLVEAGTATASHDIDNAYAPTEGFPIDENGQSVNDRDYQRDPDAQGFVEKLAADYDNRALQDAVVVSKDGIVLSGNNRTMSGDLAARQGTDTKYVEYLKEFGANKYGFTPEQMAGMEHPRVVFVPEEDLAYDAATFSRFNAREEKARSKPEEAVAKGKTVSDEVFNRIVREIGEFDTLGKFYANDSAVARVLGELLQSNAINDKDMPQMRTGTTLSPTGKEMIENVLIGKAFQSNPDAVRMMMEMPGIKQSVVFALSEIATNRTLADAGYDLSNELAGALDLIYRAKNSLGDSFKEGMSVALFGRMEGLFDDEFGVSSVTDATTLLLADVMNSTKDTDLRKVIAIYNKEAGEAAGGQMDLFAGAPLTKEEILTDINETLRNATTEEQRKLVDEAIADRERRAAEQSGGDEGAEQTPNTDERGEEVGLQHSDQESTTPKANKRAIRTIDPREMTDEERSARGERLKDAEAIEVQECIIQRTDELTARQVAEKWWDDNVGEPAFYDTEAGEVEINRNSIENSLAHKYGQMKLDAITSLVDGFENAVYLGTMPDSRERGVVDHYFAYPINYKGQRCYVFCRAMQDANKNRLYVHEVFVEDKIKKGDTLQTAASKPHGGIALYRDILANVLEVYNRHTTEKQSAETVGASQGAQPGGTDTPSRMNAPTLTGGKGSEKDGDGQIAPGDKSKEPTEAQKAAGNYKKEHRKVDGYDISIENTKGSVRKGKDADGHEWQTEMQNDYGYIRGTEGVDGDHIDVFLSDTPEEGDVFVIDQVNADGSFDEHKIMYGFPDIDSARDAYLSNYEAGWTGLGTITHVSKEEFKKWIKSSKRKTKPFAEYANVKPAEEIASAPGDKLNSGKPSHSETKGDGQEAVQVQARENARKWLKEKRRGNEEIKEEIISNEAFGAEEGSLEKTYADELRNELARREEEKKALREMPEYKPLYGALDELQRADKEHYEAMKNYDLPQEERDKLEGEKWEARKKAREEADKEFDKLTDEELKAALEANLEIQSAFGRDGLMEYSRTADRLREMERAEELQLRWKNATDLPQATQGVKAPKKAQITDFTAPKDFTSKPLRGVYHDGENGMAISSNTHVLVASKESFDVSKAGKVVYGKGKNQSEEERPLGSGGYPNYLRIIPQGAAKSIAPLTVRKIAEIERDLQEALKGLDNKYDRERATVMLRMPDGKTIAFYAGTLQKFLSASRMLDNGTLEYWGTNRPLSVRDTKGAAVVMPIQLKEAPTWRIDLGGGDGDIVVAEPGRGYSRRGKSATGMGLFDWRTQPGQQSLLDLMEGADETANLPAADKNGGENIFAQADRIGAEALKNSKKGRREALRRERAQEAERKLEALAERCDEAIDNFQAAFAAFRERGMEIDAEREEARSRIEEIRQTARDQERELNVDELEEMEGLEGRIEELDIAEQMDDEAFAEDRKRLEETLYEFYSRNNTERDARDIAREKAQRAMAEVIMRREPRATIGDSTFADRPTEKGEDPDSGKESSGEVKTAGGMIRYAGAGHLPDAEQGEFAYAERVFTLSGKYSFTGGEKVRNRGDVAFMFKALQTKAIENLFAVIVDKEGLPHVVHISMGATTATVFDIKTVVAAFEAFGGERVYLLHNHPSGNLMSSVQDESIMEQARKALGDEVEIEGLIIDTTSGKYANMFSSFYRKGGNEPFAAKRLETERVPESIGKERQIGVFEFDETDRSIGEGLPAERDSIKSAQDVVNFIAGRRFNPEERLSYLVISQSGEIVGNFHSEHTDTGEAGFVDEITSVAIKHGGESVIVYGRVEAPGKVFTPLKVAAESRGVRLLDVVGIKEGIATSKDDTYRIERKNEDLTHLPTAADVKAHLDANGIKGKETVDFLLIGKDGKISEVYESDYKDYTSKQLAEDIVSTAEYVGAVAVVPFSNRRVYYEDPIDLKGNIERKGLRVLDILGVDENGISSQLVAWAREPEAEYGSSEVERYQRIQELEPIEVRPNNKSKKELQKDYRELPVVRKNGMEIRYLRTAFGKNYKEGGLFAQVAPCLDKILDQSVLAYSETDKLGGTLRPDGTKHKSHPNVISYDNYVGKARIGDQEYFVRQTVQKTRDDTSGVHSAFVSNVELYKTTATGRTDTAILRERNTYDGIVDAKLAEFFERAKNSLEKNEGSDTNVRFSIRKEAAPKKTGIGYKVFVLKDGKLYPPMVANPGGEATPVGVWLNADAAPVAGQSKTGRNQVKAGGKGTQGGSGRLAFRPGWHLGEIPYALQFNRKGASGGRELFPGNFVWAEVEYADDIDYQNEAMSYGMNPNGKFQHSLAGLPRVPENGSYRYRTNPNPGTDPWIITGAMKVRRFLTPSEVDRMVREAGREPQRRQEGAVTDSQIEELNAKLGLGGASEREIAETMTEMAKATGVPVEIVGSREALSQREKSTGNEHASSSVVCGYTKDGKIYLNEDAMTPDTPLHEYTHLWDDMVRRENPELWERGKELLKQTPLWEEVKNDPEYADIRDNEDAIASEVHSRISGEKGARTMEDMVNRARKEGPIKEAETVSLIRRLKNWLQDMFKGLKKTLGKWSNKDLQELTLEEFNDMTLRDFAEGINPNAEVWRGSVARRAMEKNPMHDDYHTGIRGREDVKTFEEVMKEAERMQEEEGALTYPDMSLEQLKKAEEAGRGMKEPQCLFPN